MADLDYYGADYGVEEPSRLMEAARNFGFVNWAGALTSLTLTAGMAVWAVDLTFRDVSGVPVVRAIEGPMRVAPEDPGGAVAPFQGLALSDITSGGAAAPAPDQIVLAPPPVALDAPSLSERRAASDASDAARKAMPAVATDADDSETVQVAAAPGQDARPDARPVDQVAVGASAPAIESALEEAMAETPADRDVAEAVLPASIPGIANSARPRHRPADLRRAAFVAPASVPTDAPAEEPGVQVASAAPVKAVDASANVREVDPASVPAGTRVVQLGAFDSEAVARSEWVRLEGRFRDYMAGKSRMIQKARSGGRDFWRLRVVGFDDSADARRFCSELLAKDAACIPITVR